MNRDEDAKIKLLTDEFQAYLARKDYEGAEQFIEKMVEEVKGTEGSTSISLAKALMSISTVYFGQEKYQKAVNVTRKALAIFEAHFPPDHQAVSLAQTNLGLYLCPTGELQEAEAMLLKAYDSNSKKRPISAENAQTLHNMALMYRNNKRWKEAEDTYEKTIFVWTKVGGNHILATLKDYAKLYEMKGDPEMHKKTLKRGFDAAMKVFKNENHEACLVFKRELDALESGGKSKPLLSDAGGRIVSDEMSR